jgi:hypothetical protein
MISAQELAQRAKARQNIKKELYKSILGQFSRKIKARADLGDKSTVVTVPPFVVGFPKYDLPTAVRYLGRQLIRSGYKVTMVAPTSYQVSWEKVKATDTVTEEEVEPEFAFPSLMNLKKTAARYK